MRQGGVLSTFHYKRYNNPLVIEVENRFTGALIGHIRIPHATVADDLGFVTHSQMEINSCSTVDTPLQEETVMAYTLLRAVYSPIQNGHKCMAKYSYSMGEYQVQ